MWLRFSAPFDWVPPEQPATTIAYPVGAFSVTRDCAERAVAAGAAVKIKTPKRGEHAEDGESASGAAEVSTPDGGL